MNTLTLQANLDGPRYGSYFMEDSDEPGRATSRQKQILKDLIFQNIEDSIRQELCMNQLRDISESEASLWIKELENGMW